MKATIHHKPCIVIPGVIIFGNPLTIFPNGFRLCFYEAKFIYDPLILFFYFACHAEHVGVLISRTSLVSFLQYLRFSLLRKISIFVIPVFLLRRRVGSIFGPVYIWKKKKIISYFSKIFLLLSVLIYSFWFRERQYFSISVRYFFPLLIFFFAVVKFCFIF